MNILIYIQMNLKLNKVDKLQFCEFLRKIDTRKICDIMKKHMNA